MTRILRVCSGRRPIQPACSSTFAGLNPSRSELIKVPGKVTLDIKEPTENADLVLTGDGKKYPIILKGGAMPKSKANANAVTDSLRN